MTESNMFLNQLVFWSMGYGSLMGFSYSPVLMLQTNSWTMRFIIFGFSVPVSALLMTAFSFFVYGYGLLMKYIGIILSNPVFLHGMLNTMSVCLSLCSFFIILSRDWEDTDNEKKSDKKFVNMDEPEGDEKLTSNRFATISGEDIVETRCVYSKHEQSVSETEEEQSESENDENSESENIIEEKCFDSENDWRKTANFEGLRTAPPLPE